MSVISPANPRDVQDFRFKLIGRLKVFPDIGNISNTPIGLITTASRHGLIFVGTPNGFQVIPSSVVERDATGSVEQTDYLCRRIDLNCQPSHLGVNSDQSLLVVAIRKDGCAHAVLYAISTFLTKNVTPMKDLRLSPNPNSVLLDLMWNPGANNMFASCFSDGTCFVYELKSTGLDIHSIPGEAHATCLCWSPKGKQVVVGSLNGKLTQYKPDLKPVKDVPAPNVFENPAAVVNVLWISSFQFAAVYKDTVNANERQALVIINTPKNAPISFINYEDICYSTGELRSPQFYLFHQADWNVILVASANGMEVGVLGLGPDQANWEQWNLEDAARAELPLTSDKQETFPIGIGFDTSSMKEIPWGENQTIPPMPVFHILSHKGILCMFNVINIRPGAPVICKPPERSLDENCLSLFRPLPTVSTPSTPLAALQELKVPGEENSPKSSISGNSSNGRINLAQKFDSASTQLFSSATPAGIAPTNNKPFNFFSGITQLGSNTETPTKSTSLFGGSSAGLSFGSATPLGNMSTFFAKAGPSLQTSTPANFGKAASSTESQTSMFSKPSSSQQMQNQVETEQILQQQPHQLQAQQPQQFQYTSQPNQQFQVPSQPSQQFQTPSQPTQQFQIPSQPTQQFQAPSPPCQQFQVPSQPTQQFQVPSQPTQQFQVPSQPSQQFQLPSQPTQQFQTPSQSTQQFQVPSQPTQPLQLQQTQQLLNQMQQVQPIIQQQPLGVQQAPTVKSNNASKSSISIVKQVPVSESATESAATQQRNRSISNSIFQAAMQEEIASFEQDLAKLRTRSSNLNIQIGTREEQALLHQKIDDLEEFCKELDETTTTHKIEVHTLRADLMEAMLWAEDAKSRDQQFSDSSFLELSRVRELDPVSSHYWDSIKHLLYYVDSQLKQVNEHLDMQWLEFEDSCKAKEKGKMRIPSIEAVYQTMVMQNSILSKQRGQIEAILNRAGQSKNINRTSLLTRSYSQEKGENDLSKLAENLLKIKLGEPDSKIVNESIPDMIIANWVNTATTANKKFTTTKQSKLRDLLNQHTVQRICPIKVPRYRIRSNSTSSSVIHAAYMMADARPGGISSGMPIISSIENLQERGSDIGVSVGSSSEQHLLLGNKILPLNESVKFPSYNAPPQEADITNFHTSMKVISKTSLDTLPTISNNQSSMLGFNDAGSSNSGLFSNPDIGNETTLSISSVVSTPVNQPNASANLKIPSKSSESVASSLLSQPSVQSNKNSFNATAQVVTTTPKSYTTGSTHAGSNASLLKNSINVATVSPAVSCSPTEAKAISSKTTGGSSFSFVPSTLATSAVPKSTAPRTFSFGQTNLSQASTSIFAGAQAKPSQSFNFGQLLDQPSLQKDSSTTGSDEKAKVSPFSFNQMGASVPSDDCTDITSTTVEQLEGASVRDDEDTGSSSTSTSTVTPVSGPAEIPQVTDSAISNLSNTFSFALPSIDKAEKSPNTFFGQAICSPTLDGKKDNTNVAKVSSLFGGSSFFGGSSTEAPTSNVNTTTASLFGTNLQTAVTTVAPDSTATSKTSIFGGISTTASPSNPLSLFGSSESSTTPASESSDVSNVTSTTTTSLFGSVPKLATTNSLFGSGNTSSSSLFGSTNTASTTSASIFGGNPITTSAVQSNGNSQSNSTVSSFFGGSSNLFGGGAQTSTSLFGGTPVTSGGNTTLFGTSGSTASADTITTTTVTTTIPSLFGSVSTSPKSVASVFGGGAVNATTSNIFGGTSSTTTATSGITSSTPSTSSPTPESGTSTTSAAPSIFGGTVVTTSSPSIFGGTTVSTSVPSVFGGTTAATSAPSIFGGTTSTTSSSSIFGGTTTTSVPSVFGGAAVGTTSSSLFGSATTTPIFGSAGAQTPSIFGGGSSAPAFGATPTASGFGAPPVTTSTSSLFGLTAATTAPSLFGGAVTTTSASAFGGSATTSSPSVFGGASNANTTSSTSIFGTSTNSSTSSPLFGGTPTTSSLNFGAAGSTPSLFAGNTTGTTSAPPLFGTATQPLFGSSTTTSTSTSSTSLFGSANTSGSLFGGTTDKPSVFGNTGSGGFSSVFGNNASTPSSVFGQNPSTSTPSPFGQNTNTSAFGQTTFGSKPTFGQSGGSVFGQSTGFASQGNSVFGGGTSVFGGSGSSFQSPGGGSLFGGGSAAGGASPSGAFSAGGQSVAQTGFGSPNAFQNKPGGFGSPPAFGSSPPAFGSSPTFGGAPTFGGSATFGSTNKIFGSTSPTPSGFGTTQQNSTFQALASQETVTFGNLAGNQNSGFGSPQQSMFGGGQPPSNTSFAGSSFSSWR